MDNNNLSGSNDANSNESNDFIFPLDSNDTILVLTVNNARYKENVGNLVSKMIVIKELKYASLDNISRRLGFMGIKELNIFSVHNISDMPSYSIVDTNKGCLVKYIEVKLDIFIDFINKENNDFKDYNKNSLYIIRGGDYINIKNMFNTINNQEVNLGRGGSQKSHMLSPLDFRLSSYIMAITGFNHNLVNELNTFNYINKDRYLSWMDKTSFISKVKKSKLLNTGTHFKPIYINEMPNFNNSLALEEYTLECKY